MYHTLDALADLKDESELKFNRNNNVTIKSNSERRSVDIKNNGEKTNNK